MTRYQVHPQAICEAREIGAGTRIEAFAQVVAGARLGREVQVGDHAVIEGDVVIGDRATVGGGARLCGRLRIEDDVFVGPHVTFVSDPSAGEPAQRLRTLVCRGAKIAANATILPGMTIGQHAVVGAGAVVTRPVPPNAVVMGVPARIKRYVESLPKEEPQSQPAAAPAPGEIRKSRVAGVALHRLPLHRDLRGSLSVGEFPGDVPFTPKRYFLVFDVPSSEIRGEHAHRSCQLFLVCVRGAYSVVADDGVNREEFRLDHPTLGLHLPPMVWAVQYKHSPDAVLLALASEAYDPADYIRDYQEFLDEVRRGRR